MTLPASSRDLFSIVSPRGEEIVIYSEAFVPGEIVTAKLNNASRVKKATIRFRDEEFELGPESEGLERFAFIGLDLDLQPGKHSIEIAILGKDGVAESLKQEFSVLAREFPVRKLWVKEEYVTPPPEVRERIRWEAELLESIYAITTTRWLGDGKFILPHPGEIADNFGEKRIYNNVPRSVHSGVDISAPNASPVQASNAGKVALARDLYFSGKTVILDHGLGLYTYYCHFSKIKIKRGTTVKKGEVIGLVGSTGRSTGPHLHWGVKIQLSRVDPRALLRLPLQD